MATSAFIPANTFLHRLDARSKLIALLTILAIAMILDHPVYILGLLGIVLFSWLAARLPLNFLGNIFKYFSGIALLIFCIQLFFYPGEIYLLHLSRPIPLIGFSGYISLEGVLYGLALILRLIVILTIAPLLVMTTPLSELMLALVKFKIPYRFAFILTTAMSLLPSIQNRAELIQQAQLCRGVADFEQGNLILRLRASASLLIPLILGAFRDSQTLEVAISSRAFGAPVQRTYLLETHLRPVDYSLIMASGLLLLFSLWIRWG